MTNTIKKLSLLFVVLLLAACGDKSLDGTYVSDWNGRSITFKPDGTMYEAITETGKKIGNGHKYEIVGNDIQVPGTVLQLKLMDDGTINGGVMYGKMTKK